MMEAGVVIDLHDNPIHWHLPTNRTTASLPDSRDLWDVIWQNRARVAGVAHSHPGGGIPGPSHTDITTFSAVELALGRRLAWPITSADAVVVVMWIGPGQYDYQVKRIFHEPVWVAQLRRHSK